MPQQDTQSGSSFVSDIGVRQFLSLDEEGQRSALGNMTTEQKLALHRYMTAHKAEAQPRSQKDDTGVLSGAVNRTIDTVSGMRDIAGAGASAVTGDFGPARELGKGLKETYKQGGAQAKEQFKGGLEDIRKGNTAIGALGMARSAVTGASLLDPFATGSVVDLNRMQDEGRMRDAIGAGAFDVLTLWGGKKVGRTPTAANRVSKLTGAIGETGETVKNLERVLPDIEQTARTLGKPETIGDFATNVRKTLTRTQSEFDSVFDPIKKNRAYTPAIKNHIDRILRENPNLMKTAEGREEIAALRRVRRQYDKVWTLEDMNLERSRLRKQMRQMYNAAPSDATAKLKLDAELRAKKIVADSFSETVNDHLAHQTGKPQGYYDILRQKQEALIDLNDHLDSQVEKLRDKQATHESKTLGEKMRPHAYVSGGGPRAHLTGLAEAIPGGGPEATAASKIKSAFGSNVKGKVARAAILSLPVSHLATAGNEERKSRMTPPPEFDLSQSVPPPQ